MSEPALSPERIQSIRESFASQTMMQTFGARLAGLERGRAVIEAPILPVALQQQGFGHAALPFAIGDSAAGYAALSLLEADQEVVTAEIKINLTAPARGERLVATGRVARPGRRLLVVTAEVVAHEAGKETLVALLQGTMVPVPRQPDLRA